MEQAQGANRGEAYWVKRVTFEVGGGVLKKEEIKRSIE